MCGMCFLLVGCKTNPIPSVGTSTSRVCGTISSVLNSVSMARAGADECSEGKYATSIPLMHAMDTMNDVLLAFGQNGRVLHPDHGYVSTSFSSV